MSLETDIIFFWPYCTFLLPECVSVSYKFARQSVTEASPRYRVLLIELMSERTVVSSIRQKEESRQRESFIESLVRIGKVEPEGFPQIWTEL